MKVARTELLKSMTPSSFFFIHSPSSYLQGRTECARLGGPSRRLSSTGTWDVASAHKERGAAGQPSALGSGGLPDEAMSRKLLPLATVLLLFAGAAFVGGCGSSPPR